MKLIKNMAYSTVYQLLTVLLPLVTIPYVSRVLGPEGIGINAYTAAAVSYFMLFANLGIQMYGNREIAYQQANKHEKSRLFYELIILKVLMGLLSLLAYFFFTFFQKNWQFLYLLQSIQLLAVMFDISWYFMGTENFKILTIRNSLIKLLLILLIFIFVRRSEDLWLYIFLMAMTTFLGNLSVWPFLRKEISKVSFRELKVRRHLKATLLLFLPQIIIQIYLSINKTMLGLMQGMEAAGFFTQSDSIVRVAYTLTSSFSAAFLPRLSSLFSKEKSEEVKNLTLKSLELMNATSFWAIALLMGVSSSFASYFFGKEYLSVSSLIFVESLVILFISWGNVFGSQYLLASRKMSVYFMSSVLGVAVNLTVNFLLIPSMGAMGAVISTVLTELTVCLYQISSLRAIFKFSEVFGNLWKYLLSAFLCFLLVYSLDLYLSAGIFNYLLECLLGTSFYILFLYLLKAPIFQIIQPIILQIKK
ncbi:MAG: oligosaccharide flippase family protein [Lactovum sp.]